MTVYIAGPRYKAVGKDVRKPGDVIEEASRWDHRTIARLIKWRTLEVKPKGKWVYIATRRYKGKEKPGDIVDVSGLVDYVLDAMLEFHSVERVDSATLGQEKKEAKPAKVSKNVVSRAQKLLQKESAA